MKNYFQQFLVHTTYYSFPIVRLAFAPEAVSVKTPSFMFQWLNVADDHVLGRGGVLFSRSMLLRKRLGLLTRR